MDRVPSVGECWQSGGTENVWLVRWISRDKQEVGVERVWDGAKADVWDAGHVYVWPMGALAGIGKPVDDLRSRVLGLAK